MSENGDKCQIGGIDHIFANWGGGPQGKNPAFLIDDGQLQNCSQGPGVFLFCFVKRKMTLYP